MQDKLEIHARVQGRRQALRRLALLSLAWLAAPAWAQSERQAEGVLAQIGKATWLAEGQGKRVLNIFFDPNCPYCHMLYGKLRAYVDRDDLQFRWIPLGLLTPTSLPKAAAILQSADPLKAFHANENDYDFAANGQPGGGILPAAVIAPKVRQELAANMAIYNSQKLFGVPVMVWQTADGRASLFIGVPSDAQLKGMLAEIR